MISATDHDSFINESSTSYSLLKEENSTALTRAGSAAEYLLICPDCLI